MFQPEDTHTQTQGDDCEPIDVTLLSDATLKPFLHFTKPTAHFLDTVACLYFEFLHQHLWAACIKPVSYETRFSRLPDTVESEIISEQFPAPKPRELQANKMPDPHRGESGRQASIQEQPWATASC